MLTKNCREDYGRKLAGSDYPGLLSVPWVVTSPLPHPPLKILSDTEIPFIATFIDHSGLLNKLLPEFFVIYLPIFSLFRLQIFLPSSPTLFVVSRICTTYARNLRVPIHYRVLFEFSLLVFTTDSFSQVSTFFHI